MAAMLALVLLAFVHVLAAKLRFVRPVPRSRWLSAAGGVSVAYVFLHLLPSIARVEGIGFRTGLEHPLFLVTLAGLVVFYGLTLAAQRHRRRVTENRSPVSLFVLHLTAFGIYNAVVGYLVATAQHESLLFFTVAMALHFVVVDYGLELDNRGLFSRYGRWILVGFLLAGSAAGAATELNRIVVETLIAFLAGGVVLNVLKEELPEERESNFTALVAGAAVYSAILMLA